MINPLEYEQGTVLFAAPNDDKAIDEAKEYISKNKIDKNLVRLVRFMVKLENGKKSKIIAVIVK